MRKLYAFLDDLNQDYVQEYIRDEESAINSFLKTLEKTITPFYERKDTVFYSSEANKQFCRFFSKGELLKKEYLTSLEDKLAEILANAMDITHSKHENDRFYKWDICSEKIQKLEPISMLAKTTEKILNETDYYGILILPPYSYNPYSCRNFISCFKDKILDNKKLPEFVKIFYVTNEEETREWIKQNRYHLKMNKNNKHGENGQGAHKSNKRDDVSKLYCSIATAQTLLDNAICDEREKEDYYYNYDIEVGKFIIFYYEGETPQNQYHAFHLEEKDIPKKVPNKILNRLRKSYNL